MHATHIDYRSRTLACATSALIQTAPPCRRCVPFSGKKLTDAMILNGHRM